MKRKKIEINTNDMTLDRGYDEFIMHCRARNLREGTIKSYDGRIKTIYKFIDPKTPIEDTTQETVNNFVIGCKTKLEIRDITINSYLRSLKTILYYFMKMGYMEQFHIALIKYDEPIVETYTDSEVKMLLKRPDKSKCTFVEFRDWTICNTLYATGMRCSNILNLKINDIDFENNLIYLRTTKTRKPLILPVTRTLQGILKEYISIRHGENEDYLFCTAYGDRMTRDAISGTMRKYNNSRGVITTGIHRWRHTFAKQWILNHGDILKLQKILNHNNLDMVRNYVKIFTNDLQKDMEQFNPLEFIRKKSIKMKK